MVSYSGAVSKIPGKNPAGSHGHRLFSWLVAVLHSYLYTICKRVEVQFRCMCTWKKNKVPVYVQLDVTNFVGFIQQY
jgi:hypothetical protein